MSHEIPRELIGIISQKHKNIIHKGVALYLNKFPPAIGEYRVEYSHIMSLIASAVGIASEAAINKFKVFSKGTNDKSMRSIIRNELLPVMIYHIILSYYYNLSEEEQKSCEIGEKPSPQDALKFINYLFDNLGKVASFHDIRTNPKVLKNKNRKN